MSEHSGSEHEGDSDRSSSPASSIGPEEVWHRAGFNNWEYTLSGRVRAIRPEGPSHLPVTVWLDRRSPEQRAQFALEPTRVFPEDTIWDVEWRMGVHRSGISSGRLTCPVSREDLIREGLDPEQSSVGNRIFRRGSTRVVDVPEYFFENQVFTLTFL